MNDNVFNELQKKHPDPGPISENTLLNGPVENIPISYFDLIDENMIQKAARQTKGAGGPSQLDADQYHHILLSSKYKKEGKDLREEISKFAKKIASTIVDPKSIEALTSCKLIQLNKNPGIRPIGIGEILRLIGKVIGWVLKDEIQEAAGPLQSATGLKGGAEAAIHSMREIFNDHDTKAVILVDASDAFNSLNRQVALHNIRIICPAFSTILINTYRKPTLLVVLGGKEMLSKEGSTQGDNLAMAFYALGIKPIQDALKLISPQTIQVWLADDAAGASSLVNLKAWWDTIITEGPKLGYYVNESKSWLIIKDASQLDYTKKLFYDPAIKYTTEGKRHLGATIGNDEFRTAYATEKVKE